MKNNPSDRKVAHQYAGGIYWIRVYRLRDKDGVDHSGNREYLDTIFHTDEEAEEAAAAMNMLERKEAR